MTVQTTPSSETDGRRTVLEVVAGAVRREAHVLADQPELTWQQLYNRLQWEEDPVPGLLEPQLRRRSARGAVPWLRTRTRLPESEALRLTLTGHTGPVFGCAVSPDSSFVVSASGDQTLKIWDVARGKERLTLKGHTGPVRACAASPDGSFVVSASADTTLKLWNPASGEDLRTLQGHTREVVACDVSPGGVLRSLEK
jgi:WD40 repeat protein